VQACLPCGSVYGKTFSWDDLDWEDPTGVADYTSTPPPAPGCIFCNQYQDEAGQQTCKRCSPLESENGRIVPLSYKDSNDVVDSEGACKYIENVHFALERRRGVYPPSKFAVCDVAPDLKEVTHISVCLYRYASLVATRRPEPYQTFRTEWYQQSSKGGGAYAKYATVQAYYTKASCSANYLDYYVIKRAKEAESAECEEEMSYTEQRYYAYTLTPYVDAYGTVEKFWTSHDTAINTLLAFRL
jgi:hypothetical protein